MKFTKEGLEKLIEKVRNDKSYPTIVFNCVGCGRRIETTYIDGIPLCSFCRKKRFEEFGGRNLKNGRADYM